MTVNAEFRMPSLGADMESGVLLEWLVHPGDTVQKGDIVAVVDTAKAAVEVECFTSGVVKELLVEPGTRVAVGGVLATITTGAEPQTAPEPQIGAAAGFGASGPGVPVGAGDPLNGPHPSGVVTSPLVRHLAEQLHVDTTSLSGSGDGGRVTRADVLGHAPEPVKISPRAKKLAAQLGVDLAAVTGTGPSGTITGEDVRRAQIPKRAQGIDTKAMRATIAALMARSKKEIPHYYLTEQVDLATATDWLRDRNRSLPVPQRLVSAVMLLKAAARAAALVPELNGFWKDGAFSPSQAVHLGVAISLRGGGLVAPAIHRADQLDLSALMAGLRDLVTRTRSGRLRSGELADPTITVSNLGEQGVESILGVIYPPQVALVGFGRIAERPWAVGGLIGVRPLVTVSLAADHRVTDGATGARYLQAVNQLLQQPEEL